MKRVEERKHALIDQQAYTAELQAKIEGLQDEVFIKTEMLNKQVNKMTIKDISTIHRFLGVIEGVTVSLPQDTQTMIYDYLEIVDEILNAEEKECLK